MDPLKKLMGNFKGESIDHLFLVGGSTFMKKIRELLINITKKVPCPNIDPREAVSLGACIAGAWKVSKEKNEFGAFKAEFKSVIDVLMKENENLDIVKNSKENENLDIVKNSKENENLDIVKNSKENENLYIFNNSKETDYFVSPKDDLFNPNDENTKKSDLLNEKYLFNQNKHYCSTIKTKHSNKTADYSSKEIDDSINPNNENAIKSEMLNEKNSFNQNNYYRFPIKSNQMSRIEDYSSKEIDDSINPSNVNIIKSEMLNEKNSFNQNNYYHRFSMKSSNSNQIESDSLTKENSQSKGRNLPSSRNGKPKPNITQSNLNGYLGTKYSHFYDDDVDILPNKSKQNEKSNQIGDQSFQKNQYETRNKQKGYDRNYTSNSSNQSSPRNNQTKYYSKYTNNSSNQSSPRNNQTKYYSNYTSNSSNLFSPRNNQTKYYSDYTNNSSNQSNQIKQTDLKRYKKETSNYYGKYDMSPNNKCSTRKAEDFSFENNWNPSNDNKKRRKKSIENRSSSNSNLSEKAISPRRSSSTKSKIADTKKDPNIYCQKDSHKKNYNSQLSGRKYGRPY